MAVADRCKRCITGGGRLRPPEERGRSGHMNDALGYCSYCYGLLSFYKWDEEKVELHELNQQLKRELKNGKADQRGSSQDEPGLAKDATGDNPRRKARNARLSSGECNQRTDNEGSPVSEARPRCDEVREGMCQDGHTGNNKPQDTSTCLW